jgi:hypothetical protein
MPKQIEPGVLYVSEEFGTAAHLCACGCGAKIRTPLGPTEWKVEDTPAGPNLTPSVGSWQQKCQSHYWIERGNVVWAPKSTATEIKAGRRREDRRRKAYYKTLEGGRKSWAGKAWNWITKLF